MTNDILGSSDPLGAGTGPENRGALHGAWQVRLLQLPLRQHARHGSPTWQEAPVSESGQCGFESHLWHLSDR